MAYEGRMIMVCRNLLAAAVAASLLLSATDFVALAAGKEAKAAKTKVYVSKKRWRGYGFLPGYRPQLAESQGTPVYGRPLPRREMRYFDFYGNVRYGWGAPGYYRGRWNGGSFGPCWTYTPIGMMPNCGQ
jgi:hypothetical protein